MANSADIRKAIFTRLDSQLSQNVYSYVPQGAAYPYVRLDGLAVTNADTKTETMGLYTIDVHVFDKDTGSALGVEGIAEQVRNALHHHALSVEDGTSLDCRWISQLTIQEKEPNERYWHVVITFEVMVEDA
jgi:hypothetical protein